MPGWPRKNDEMRLYRDKDGSFMLVLTCNGMSPFGNYDCAANAYEGPSPSLCGTSVSPAYIAHNWLKRFQWCDLPEVWQKAFMRYMDRPEFDSPFDPAKVRGLWRVGNQPVV